MAFPVKFPIIKRRTPILDAASRFKMRIAGVKKRFVIMVGEKEYAEQDDLFAAKEKYKGAAKKFGKDKIVSLWDGERRMEATIPAGAE